MRPVIFCKLNETENLFFFSWHSNNYVLYGLASEIQVLCRIWHVKLLNRSIVDSFNDPLENAC